MKGEDIMKNRDTILILLGAIALLCALSCGKYFLKAMLRAQAAGKQPVTSSMSSSDQIIADTLTLSPFDKLELDVGSIDTYIEVGDEYRLDYRAYGYNAPIVEENNGKLSIRQPQHDRMFRVHLTNENEYYKLTVPADIGILGSDLSATSGLISIKDIDIEGDIMLTSGELILENSEGDSLKIDLTSGDADIRGIAYNKLDLIETSGNIYAANVKAEEITGDITSGSIRLKELDLKKADFYSTSGDIELEILGKEEDFSYALHATSGDFMIGDRHFNKDYKAGSDTDNLITADITSGDFSISFTGK